MTDSQSLLDEALRLGDLELQLLASGEMGEAREAALERKKLISEVLEANGGASFELAARDLTELRDKLGQLMALQGRLTSEARQLHKDVRSELLRTRQESTRFAGYGKTLGVGGTRNGLLHKRS